jgi:hypothetical protein
MSAQTAIVTEHIRANARVKVAQNFVAAVFIVIAGLCVLFAPAGREVAAEAIGGALVILGAGIAGYANLVVKTPHVDISAGSGPGKDGNTDSSG